MHANLTSSEMAALAAINSKHVSCAGLAGELKVSRAKAASIIASLRKKGIPITSRRDESGWYYEIEASRPDPGLATLIGVGGPGRKDFSESIDEILAEDLSNKSAAKRVKAS